MHRFYKWFRLFRCLGSKSVSTSDFPRVWRSKTYIQF